MSRNCVSGLKTELPNICHNVGDSQLCMLCIVNLNTFRGFIHVLFMTRWNSGYWVFQGCLTVLVLCKSIFPSFSSSFGGGDLRGCIFLRGRGSLNWKARGKEVA